MSEGEKPKSRGEQLAEKLAGSNPVEPKPSGEPTPVGEVKAEPPTTPPAASGPADAASTKAADAHAHANPQADATTKPPPADDAAVEKAAADMAASQKAAADKKAADKKAADDKAKAEKKAAEDRAEAERKANLPPEPPAWYQTLRADPPFHIRLALGAAMVALIFAVWWFVTRGAAHEAIISPSKLVSPGNTFGATDSLLERDLFDSILDTLQRVFLGVGLAAIVGISLGVVSGAQRGVSAALTPVVIFLRSVPMGALLPLTLLMFGDGEKQKWMFIFLAVVPFVFSDTLKAVASVPDRYVETAQTLGASKRQIVMKVLVPLSLPDIITSLRFQFGLALGYIILAEAGSTFVDHGLGVMIEISQKRALREHIFLLLFVIALLAFVLDLLMRTLQRGAFSWRKDL